MDQSGNREEIQPLKAGDEELEAWATSDSGNNNAASKLQQLRSDSSTKWCMMTCVCISYLSLFHSSVCVSAIEEKIIDLFDITLSEFGLLSDSILLLAGCPAAFFTPQIIYLLNNNIYHAMIFGMYYICLP